MIPNIGIGTGGLDYHATYNTVLNALKIGYRLIDTAETYMNEDAVGDAIIDSKINRNEIIIISKYAGYSKYTNVASFGNSNDVRNSFNESLQKLKTNYIDIYLVHLPFCCKPGNGWEPYYDNKYKNYKDRLSVWRQFIQLKEQKLVNYIGVSNWTIGNLEEIKINKLMMPEIIQTEWCPSYYDLKLYDYCNINNIKIIGYGIFSRNDINEIRHFTFTTTGKSLSDILLKWCNQRNIIVIPRSNNTDNLLKNYNTIHENWELSEDDMKMIDGISQKEKGHALTTVYNKNTNIDIWQPLIISISKNENYSNFFIDDKLQQLVNGEISCIIFKNILTENECDTILNTMETNNLTKNQIPFDNYGIRFRRTEIGLTLDVPEFQTNPNSYWNECKKANELFENIFSSSPIENAQRWPHIHENTINPLDILSLCVKNIAGDNYTVKQMEKDGITSPRGVFRFLISISDGIYSHSDVRQSEHTGCELTKELKTEFPYHTDGFNYGELSNKEFNIDRSLYPTIMSANTNSIIAILLIVNQTENNRNEVDLYNCLVDELQSHKDEIGMYSHWMGTKYHNHNALEKILNTKPFFSPILEKGDVYIFSASRIHKLNTIMDNGNRITFASFAHVSSNNEIILYQ